MNGTLFDLPPVAEPRLAIEPPLPSATCRTCRHRERWQCGGKIIQYCGKIRSSRTGNGLKKIKVSKPACSQYVETAQN